MFYERLSPQRELVIEAVLRLTNSDEVGNVAMLRAISVPLVFGLLECAEANRGDTLHLSTSDCCAMCVTGQF